MMFLFSKFVLITSCHYCFLSRDRFLGQENDTRTNYESGISSSFNNTGNSVEYRSSQELFSQSNRNSSQFGVSISTDYLKKKKIIITVPLNTWTYIIRKKMQLLH